MQTERIDRENGQRDGIKPKKFDQKYTQPKRTVESSSEYLGSRDVSRTPRKGTKEKGAERAINGVILMKMYRLQEGGGSVTGILRN